MAIEIIMPKLSDTMTEGHLGAWRKSVGEKVERGDVIAEVETDKAVMDLETFSSGILIEQRVQAGTLVPVGTVIGLIGLPDEALPPDAVPVIVSSPEQNVFVTGEPAMPASLQLPTAEQPHISHAGQAAPIVRRRAAELGIELENIAGSGPGGRILMDDLNKLINADQAAHTSSIVIVKDTVQKTISPASGIVSGVADTVEPLSRMRSAIARTTTDSWRTVPHFFVSREIEMESAEKVVQEFQAEGVAVSLNAMILGAVVHSLVSHPRLNSALQDNSMVMYPTVNLGFAVALADGLQVPVIKGAETMGVRELTDESGRLTRKARAGTIGLDEISGGTFSVSNLGMYGVDAFTSIIMPSQAGILAIGAVADRPLVRNGSVEAGRVMSVTLSCDHRIIDGVYAAIFLTEIKRLLENPAELPT